MELWSDWFASTSDSTAVCRLLLVIAILFLAGWKDFVPLTRLGVYGHINFVTINIFLDQLVTWLYCLYISCSEAPKYQWPSMSPYIRVSLKAFYIYKRFELQNILYTSIARLTDGNEHSIHSPIASPVPSLYWRWLETTRIGKLMEAERTPDIDIRSPSRCLCIQRWLIKYLGTVGVDVICPHMWWPRLTYDVR